MTHRIAPPVPRRIMMLIAAIIVASVTAVCVAVPNAQAHHRSHVTMDITKTIGASQAYGMAKGYEQMTALGIPACASHGTAAFAAAIAKYKSALRLTPLGTIS